MSSIKNAINGLNKEAKLTFVLGKIISFDKGGIQSKSNYIHVRQHNNSKLDKYRIDFLSLLMHPVGVILYITLLSVRKNEQNFGIAEDLWNLPTTQTAVVNAIVLTRLNTDPNGFCILYVDNCYSVPELFVMLKTKYKILAFGTVWTNRKGWDQMVINLSKLATKVNLKAFYNPINGLIFGQWKDNNVVSSLSTLPLDGSNITM